MSVGAGRLSKGFDSFACWLLAGFGAAVVICIGKDSTTGLLTAWVLRMVVKCFFGAAVAVVIQKYLSLVIVGASEAGEHARTAMNEAREQATAKGIEAEIDLQAFMDHLLAGLAPPVRGLVRHFLSKDQEALLVRRGIGLYKLAQFQGALLLTEIILFLVAVGTVARNIH